MVSKELSEEKASGLILFGNLLIAAGLVALAFEFIIGCMIPRLGMFQGLMVTIIKTLFNAVGYPDLQTRIANVSKTSGEIISVRLWDTLILLSIFVAVPAGVILKIRATKLLEGLKTETPEMPRASDLGSGGNGLGSEG
jgi:hypothetical protein